MISLLRIVAGWFGYRIVPAKPPGNAIWAMGQAADVLVSRECRERMYRAATDPESFW